MSVQIITGDCLEVLRTLPDCSVDAVVTDPPYGLSFMGKRWDYDVPGVEIWAECLRVLKPGGHLLAFAGTRTHHRMAVRIEDAGFEIRDMIAWVYGSGFPKSMNVANAIHDAAIGQPQGGAKPSSKNHGKFKGGCSDENETGRGFGAGPGQFMAEAGSKSERDLVEQAQAWQGWGTALKPALEPITVARKPLSGTVAENVLTHGTGALNIDGCRVPGEPVPVFDTVGGRKFEQSHTQQDRRTYQVGTSDAGRWPAHLIHDGSDEVLRAFPVTTSGVKVGGQYARSAGVHDGGQRADGTACYGDTGSAARFFKECNEWQDRSQDLSNADIATPNLCLQSVVGAIVQSVAATWPSLAGIVSSDLTEPSMSATASECESIAAVCTAAITVIGSGCLHESRHEKRTPSGSLASAVAVREPTGITTITASLLKSDGSVGRATFSITPTSLDRGELGSRFKYCAKASRADRNEGCEGMEQRMPSNAVDRASQREGQEGATGRGSRSGPRENHHPTVKPTDLMRYLCRLVTPAGGVVLDPFMGSGSTGKGAVIEGFRFIGIEREAEYVEIARARIAAAQAGAEKAAEPSRQPDLFGSAA